MQEKQKLSLNELANKHGTDKGDGCHDRHDYAKVYEHLIRLLCGIIPQDDKAMPQAVLVRMLEIGIWDPRNPGASIRMWREFLPKAEIWGIDVNPECSVLSRECGVNIHLVNQGDRERLQKAAEEIGSLDFVVDDGSHQAAHQRISLETIWPFVRVGGWYAIEDLHAPQSSSYEGLAELGRRLGAEVCAQDNPKLIVLLKS
jgi:hypothetical protein